MAGTGRDQYVIDFQGSLATSASPGFTWGKSGNVPSGIWLLNDSVPSNVAGRAIYVYNGLITAIFVRCQNASTFDLEVYEHDGTTFTLLYTVNVSATRAHDEVITTEINLTNGKELAIKVVNGSTKNPVVGLQLTGSLEP